MKMLKVGFAAAALFFVASASVAQQYPQRDVRMIVPQTTGGATDLLARLFAEKLSQRWGRSVFVENKAGAGGIIGVQSVAIAPNDGYTLLMSSDGPQAINASLYKSLPYDPIKDFTPIAMIGAVAFLIATNNQLGVSDFPALVKLAQSKPGLTFGSAGTGSLNHLIGEMINQATDMKLEHVPYKGAAPALTDLLGNHVSTVVASVPSIAQQVDNGSLKALAVTSAARSQRLPNLPTIAELGYPQFGVSPWVGLLGPANMPMEIVAKISADITLILKEPAVIARILSIGMEPLATTPEQFKTLLAQDIEKWGRVVKKQILRHSKNQPFLFLMDNKAMSIAAQMKDVLAAATNTQRYDAVVVGAGFAGLYMLKRLRALGLSVRVFEAGSNVGGTWFWNKYPGARCDVESLEYSYSFDEDLQQDWVWPERYAEQPVILKYLNHVADRFDLRKDIELNQRISSAHYDSERCLWTLSTQRDDVVEAQFCVMATGCLSTAKLPEIPGIDRFKGKWYHSGLWPEQGVDFTGQRVGVIGTGSSAVQMIPLIAKEAKQLYVFQRHANFVVPAHNRPLDAAVHQAHQANYVEHRAEAQLTPFCIGGHPKPSKKAFEVSAQERQETYETKWAKGGAISFLYTYTDLLVSKEANETAGEFVRQKIRQTVKDPQTAEDLCPNDHYIGTKRLCVDTGYFETYNRDNVRLVNVQKAPIQEIEPDGLKTENESFALDAIVFATGFDAMTGALFEIDIRGKQGVELKTKWADGPATYLGLMTAGFPNMFIVTGPGSPSVKTNMVCAIEQHVDWIAACIEQIRLQRLQEIDADPSAQAQWTQHVNDVGDSTLYPLANSWYVGANVPGKPRVFTPYVAGLDVYRKKCDEVTTQNYAGFLKR